MQGRFEHKILIENKLEEILKDYPDYLKNYYYNMSGNTAASKLTYIQNIGQFLRFYSFEKGIVKVKDVSVEDITINDINCYITERKKEIVRGKPISNATIATQISCIKSFFGYLYEMGVIEQDPTRTLKRPKVQEKEVITFLEKDERQKIFQNVDAGVGSSRRRNRQEKYKNRDKLIFLLGFATGCRITALDEINIGDIDFIAKTLSVIDKGEKKRVFTLTDEIMTSIEAWCVDREKLPGADQTEALFVAVYKGGCKRITTQCIRDIVKKYSSYAGIEMVPHDMRRTFGTNFYRISNDIYATAEAMGHSSVQTTKRYAAPDNRKIENIRRQVIKNII